MRREADDDREATNRLPADNPYRPSFCPGESAQSTSKLEFLWPKTQHRCLLLALLAWPIVMSLTTIVGRPIEAATGVRDFGLFVFNGTFPLFCIYEISLWIRGFTRSDHSWFSIIYAILTLPAWFMITMIVTFIFFPLGRISPTF